MSKGVSPRRRWRNSCKDIKISKRQPSHYQRRGGTLLLNRFCSSSRKKSKAQNDSGILSGREEAPSTSATAIKRERSMISKGVSGLSGKNNEASGPLSASSVSGKDKENSRICFTRLLELLRLHQAHFLRLFHKGFDSFLHKDCIGNGRVLNFQTGKGFVTLHKHVASVAHQHISYIKRSVKPGYQNDDCSTFKEMLNIILGGRSFDFYEMTG
ncbi:hypothetical protein TNIN_259871 [Trichonephila inaurata madagascariensis]|uniref:Uncharacterized protein n=1 Tax=Trichonephila inaurata madagascariensis TaxID=2747483 RepID=A0A8X7BU08_9ARAC|nr:hypothetical protein TNIN_259871 [Trichonephila inaurata madagascariensis]